MTESELIKALIESQSSGGSGKGMSFWASAAQCGKRALLSLRVEAQRDPDAEAPYFGIGSMYHKMHELWAQGIDVKLTTLGNEKMAEAYRLFSGWKATYPLDLYGRILASEAQVPSGEAVANIIRERLGADVTARPDRVVHLSSSDIARLKQTRALELPGPGEYIIDFKTASQVGPDMTYTEGLQSLWYPLAWEVQTGRRVEGIIFDIIYRFPRRASKAITQENFHAVFAPHPGDQGWHELKGLIAQGVSNVERAKSTGQGNRAECVKWGAFRTEVCGYRTTLCDGA